MAPDTAVDPPNAAEGAPAQELPSRPAKQPKEKAAKEKPAKGGKKGGLEVRKPSSPASGFKKS